MTRIPVYDVLHHVSPLYPFVLINCCFSYSRYRVFALALRNPSHVTTRS